MSSPIILTMDKLISSESIHIQENNADKKFHLQLQILHYLHLLIASTIVLAKSSGLPFYLQNQPHYEDLQILQFI